MTDLIDKVNELTEGEFGYLKLSSAEVCISSKSISLNIIYPDEMHASVTASVERIKAAVIKALNSSATVIVKLTRSHFDSDHFKTKLFTFLMDYPVLSNGLREEDVTITRTGDNFQIELGIEKSVLDYCEDKQLINPLRQFIDRNYCEHIEISFKKRDSIVELTDSIDEYESELEYVSSGVALENPDSARYIRCENVEDFIGDIIYDRAAYIEDAIRPRENLVVCGTVSNFKEVERKEKPDGTKPRCKFFYKFTLTDFTGSIDCVYFPSKKTENQIKLLKDGKQVVTCGSLDLDKFRPGAMSYSVRRISLCTLPKNFKINRLVRKVAEKYRNVFPKPYVKVRQADLLAVPEEPARYLIGKTFCVFDIETTGFNPETDKIIEIGAVKIVDGVIKETFETFVDPGIPLPEKIIKLTHITDDDLKGQPDIESVLPDFFKFSYNTVLVGHNVQFDYGFMSMVGARYNIYFENDRVDTLALGRRYVPGLSNYKLKKLTEYFDIKNEGAHRGIYDALATAELFMKLSKFIA